MGKIKHHVLCINFTEGGFKSVDMKHKILALKCSWIQKLYNENFHKWKIIPVRYIHKAFGKNVSFTMYVCMYVCKYVCMYVYMYVCMCVCVCVYVCMDGFPDDDKQEILELKFFSVFC